MSRKLNDLQMYMAEEFIEDYLAGRMSRRDMIKRVIGITGGIASAATLLAALGCQPAAPASPEPTSPAAEPTPAPAATGTAGPAPTAVVTTTATQTVSVPRSPLSVRADDSAIQAGDVSFPGDGATLLGYLAQPKGGGPFPAALVCHENRGLVEHIRDVTRRLGKAGYVALAVDLLSRDGGTAKVDPAQVPGKLGANPDQMVGDFRSGLRYLQSLNSVRKDSIGMTGFCFGGGITWRAATQITELKAAVPYYGPNPPLEDVPKIRAAVLAIYGGLDQRINAGIQAIEEAMKRENKVFQKIIYPGANHAFNNDTGPNWDQTAALDAWQKTLDWFKQYLV